MFVGVCRLSLRIPGARTLKDRRRVVLSFKERTQARFRVSVAEVGALDDPRAAVLGVAVVANEAAQCDAVLGSVAAAAQTLPDAVLLDWSTEILPFGRGGGGLGGGLEERLDPAFRADGPRSGEDEET
jgi:uncharacterized protein YlxP (DUF503 family)